MQKRAARRGVRALAFLLCLLMVVSLLPVMGANAADGGNAVTNPAYTGADSGLVLSKTLTEDSNGNYSLKLEAYATGDVTTTPDTVAPMDIVLVLDQSGSMSYNFGKSVQLQNADKVKGATAGYYVYSESGWYTTYYYLVKYNASTKQWQRSENGTSWSNISNQNTTSVYVSRLGALKDAVTAFVNSIQQNATEHGVDHRIAMIGFASDNGKYYNTELLTGVTIREQSRSDVYDPTGTSYLYPNAKRYIGASNPTNADYQKSLVNVRTDTGSLTKAIDALTAHGGTQTNDGLSMAKKVFDNNPLPTDSTRQRVVVLFTDGDTNSDRTTTLQTAYSLKQANASVYTVGIFDGADPTLSQNKAGNANNFMHYLSSNYPDTQNWNSPGTGTRPATDNDPSYYLAASDAAALNNVFSTIQGSITGSSKVNLTAEAVLKDVVSDKFTVPTNVTLSAASYACTGKADDGSFTWNETASYTYNPVRDGQTVTVTGFDYKENYVAMLGDEPHGQKLVLTISGLIPKDSGEQVFSNTDASGVYENGTSETPVAQFPMPSTNIPVYTKVLDFSMAANIATHVLQTNSALTGAYGTFNVSEDAGKNLTYKLGNRVADGNLVFDGVDSVLFYGDYNDDGNDTAARWNKVNVIPANNVYFDDDLLNSSSDFTDGDYGYDENVPSTTSTTPVQPENGENMAVRTFTFTGSRIDLYCTTADSTRTVTAAIYKASDYKSDPSSEPIRMMAMNNRYQSGTLYNVPTLSFDMKDRDTYTVVLYASTNANYQLDGIRVYNPGSADVDAMYEAGEQNATFLKVRDLLLNADDGKGSFGEIDGQSGVVYVDNTNKLGQTTEDIGTYRDVGPKNEVYLAKNSAIAFKVGGYQDGKTVMVGLSAPEAKSGKVMMSNGIEKAPTDVKSAVDMYYNVTPNADGYVVIKNTSDALISVTNVKLSGTANANGANTLSVDEGLLAYMASFDTLEVTEPTPVDPEPSPDTPAQNNTISAIIHAIWAQVKTSIDRLFGRL